MLYLSSSPSSSCLSPRPYCKLNLSAFSILFQLLGLLFDVMGRLKLVSSFFNWVLFVFDSKGVWVAGGFHGDPHRRSEQGREETVQVLRELVYS